MVLKRLHTASATPDKCLLKNINIYWGYGNYRATTLGTTRTVIGQLGLFVFFQFSGEKQFEQRFSNLIFSGTRNNKNTRSKDISPLFVLFGCR